MNTQELNKLTKYYMSIVEENDLVFPDYELKCWQEAYKQLGENNEEKDRLHKD